MRIARFWVVGGVAAIVLLLAGNLFMAGTLLGHGLFARGGEAPEAPITRFLRTVPTEARPVLRAVFLDHREDLRARFGDLVSARRRMTDLLAAPQVDDAATAEAMSDLRAATAELQAVLHEVLLDAARRLPPDVRAEWWSQPPGGRRSGL
ncbi:putative membrane protein [Constrictibacter sp. MBR-5]|jgi:uncharacterized membrane protein|uniref:periplasmic heavy metal sensor n=1 Tax=Constrictibacter sp. MBR-5 TaxID=3156467 RepID=UPI00339ABE6F